MGTQVVRHKSRKVGEKFQFTANGETSWSFIAEGDGVIYNDSERTNVASYTINGVSETLPFTLVNGTSYTIAINKTTGGQTAELNLLTRRQVDKQNVINVPDFGQYDGRYLFVLTDTQVHKLDTELLKSPNYLGAGSWTTSPILGAKTLPVMTGGTGSYYYSMCFAKHNGGGGEMFVIGKPVTPSSTTGTYYSGLLNVGTLNFTDLAGNNDQLTIGRTGNIISQCLYYDYIKDYVYYGNSEFTFPIDLPNQLMLPYFTDRRRTQISGVIDADSWTWNQFNPVSNQFNRQWSVELGLNDSQSFQVSAYKSKTAVYAGNYDLLTGLSFGYDIAANQFTQGYNSLGDVSFAFNLTAGGLVRSSLVDSDLGYLVTTRNTLNRFQFLNLRNTSEWLTTDLVTDMASGQSSMNNLMSSKYSGLFFAKGVDGNGTKRLYVFEISGSTVTVRYLDFAEDIKHIYTNQLLT